MDTFDTFAQGLFVVKSENSSFNNDFSGLPRRLPDQNGTIYATDKALKYCLRSYLNDLGKNLFVWRRYDKTGKPLNINANYKKLFKEDPKKSERLPVYENLLKSLDVRLFGVTYAGEVNISITGTTQISYGINKLNENIYFTNDILSPYADLKKDAKQQTIGNETKTFRASYVYDFQINPNNLISDIEFLEGANSHYLKQSDVDLFVEGLRKSVTSVTSSSKLGSTSQLVLFAKMKGEKNKNTGKINSHILPQMKNHVKISVQEGITKIDLTKVFEMFKTYKDCIKTIDIYYNKFETKVEGVTQIDGVKLAGYHIDTLKCYI